MVMRYTLDTFYRSKEWEKLMKVIRLQRVNANGDLVCDCCGEPIVRSYDCIGHHVKPLTEENVNDAAISLNPDNIQLVHHRCHNRIHKKFYYGEEARQVYLVYGSPLSGKTSWVWDAKTDGDLIVDMDSIWQCISGCDRYVKPGALNSCAFGVRDYLIDCIKYRRGKWRNAYLVGGYPMISERERLCRELRAREVFIDTPKDECIRRLSLCTDNRDKIEWQKFIDDWWKRYSPVLSYVKA